MKNQRLIGIVLGLMSIPCLWGQPGEVSWDEFQGNFTTYVSLQPEEDLFVHTDKPAYAVGETLWMSIYALDGALHSPTSLSKIVYVELLDEQANPILQEKCLLESGRGAGSFFLSAQLASGVYLLRAYTSWMKNEQAPFYFEQRIPIVNVTAPPQPSQTPQPAALAFFPEGGHWLASLPQRMAIRVPPTWLNSTIWIIEEQGDTVAQVVPDLLGIGLLEMAPRPGIQYRAQVAGHPESFPLPPTESKGYSLHVSPQKTGVKVRVQGTEGTSSGAQVYLMAHQQGLTKWQEVLDLAGSNSEVVIPVNRLSPGICQITGFNDRFEVLGERLIYVPVQDKSSLSIAFEGNQTTYRAREKVNMRMLGMSSQLAEAGTFSISVYKVPPDFPVSSLSIQHPFYHNSPLGSTHWDLQHATSSTSQLDRYLMACTPQRIDWEAVRREISAPIQFPPETRGPILHGRRFLSATAPSNAPLFVSFPGKKPDLYRIPTDDQGEFYLELSPHLSSGEMLFWSPKGSVPRSALELYTPFKPAPAPSPSAYLAEAHWNVLAESYGVNAQIAFSYNSPSYLLNSPSSSKTYRPFYGDAEYVYPLDEYTRFPKVEEVFSEYIPFVQRKSINDKPYAYLWDEYANTYTLSNSTVFDTAALVMIDGVPVTDPEKFWQFNVLDIEKIDIVAKKFYLGSFPFHGMVHAYTYKRNFGGKKLPDNLLRIPYQGPQQARTFFAPNYLQRSAPDIRTPDFRTTLLWLPNVHFEDSEAWISFFTSDDTGRYRVVVNGITDQGEKIFVENEFTVTADF